MYERISTWRVVLDRSLVSFELVDPREPFFIRAPWNITLEESFMHLQMCSVRMAMVRKKRNTIERFHQADGARVTYRKAEFLSNTVNSPFVWTPPFVHSSPWGQVYRPFPRDFS